MPNRSSSNKPPSDPVDAAFDVMRHVIDSEQTDDPRERVKELETLCNEVLQFARVAQLPTRVVAALENAAHGRHPGPSLLPITPPDFPERAAVALGRSGGLKGGNARAKALSPKRRRQIAIRAAAARWKSRH